MDTLKPSQPWKRTMWTLWVCVLLCSASFSIAVPFLPLFLFELGVEKSAVNLWAGIIHASAYLVGALMAPLWGSVADKYGKRKMVIRAGFGLAIIFALTGFVRNPWELIGVRILHGFVGGFIPASMAIVASVVPKERLGSSLGMMQAGTMTGAIIGPLLGGLLAVWFGQRTSFIVAGGIIFLATIAVIIWVKEGTTSTPAKTTGMLQGIREAFHSRTLVNLLFLLVLFQVSINMMQPLLTLHIAEMQGSLDNAVLSSGIIFSLIGIAGIIASPIWGRVGEARDYSHLLMFCLICSGMVVTMQYFVQSLWLFTIVQFVFGLFIAGVVPSVNTLMLRNTDNSFRGRSFGLTASANQLGGMIGPLIGGAMGYFLSTNWVFVTSGLLLFSVGLTMLIRSRMVKVKSL